MSQLSAHLTSILQVMLDVGGDFSSLVLRPAPAFCNLMRWKASLATKPSLVKRHWHINFTRPFNLTSVSTWWCNCLYAPPPTVISASKVIASDPNGKSDPYCVVYLGPSTEHAHKTEVKAATLDPVWNETFYFQGRSLEPLVTVSGQQLQWFSLCLCSWSVWFCIHILITFFLHPHAVNQVYLAVLWYNTNHYPKARQTTFIVSHQRLHPLRPAASTIIAFQAMTPPLLMAIVP